MNNDFDDKEELEEIIDDDQDDDIEEIYEEYIDDNDEDLSIQDIPQTTIKNSSSLKNTLKNNKNNINNINNTESSNEQIQIPKSLSPSKTNFNSKNNSSVPEKLKAVRNIKNPKGPANNPNSSNNNEKNNDKSKEKTNKTEEKSTKNVSSSSDDTNSNKEKEENKNPLKDITPSGDAKNKKEFLQENGGQIAKATADIVAGNKVEGAIEVAKLAKNYLKKFWKKYVIMFFAGFFAVVLIFFAIMSPIIENLDKYKEYLEGIMSFSERTKNIYSGLGFKTTDEAFYQELEDQYVLSNGEVDLPLVMSALLYTESTNDYSTDYSINEDNKNLFESLQEVLQKYAGASEYTQGQILRVRKLCEGMTGDAEGEKVTFEEFLTQYKNMLLVSTQNAKESLLGEILTNSNPFSKLVEVFKTTYNFIFGDTFVTADGELINAIKQSFETGTFGLKSITNISFGLEDGKPQVYVTMQVKKYSEDAFKTYLSTYIKKMPEFKPIIKNLEGVALDKEIDRIIKEIYDRRSWYVGVYGNIEGNSEGYEKSCVGAISNDLVSELALPVKVTSSSVTFNGEYAFGVTTAKMHNGIDLNADTTGTKEGDSVYAIAVGEVDSIDKDESCNKATDETCDDKGSYIKLKHSTMVDGTTYKFYSVYMNLQANSTKLKKGDKVNKGDEIGKAGNTGDATIPQVHFEFHNENNLPIDPTNLFITCTQGELSGDSNEEKIWFYLRNLGYSEAATAAAMGNLSVESGLEPQRVQGTPLGSQESIEYTAKVDNGTISKNDFVNNGPGGGGYGLAQWTYYTRKQKLYEYKKKEKTSIGDLQMQLGYLMTEINGSWSSTKTYKQWKNAKERSDIDSSTTAFCNGFENPGTPHLDSRIKNAKDIYDRNKGKTAVSKSNVTASSNSIIASAKEIKKYIAENGYRYGALGVDVKDAKKARTIDCSSYVSWVLYNAGYSEFGGRQNTSVSFQANSWGFKVIDKKNVKPGDILVYQTSTTGHVEIYAGMSGGQVKVYNAGSNNAIKNSGTTTSYRGLSQTTKILRPSK